MAWPRGRSADGGLDQVPLPSTSGALWLCGKRVVGPDPDGALARVDADMIVSFNEPHELQRDYPDYVQWLVDNEGDRAMWFPVPDLAAPPVHHARRWVERMTDKLSEGGGLILHCAGGIGRAPTMATCVLVRLGMTADDALETIAGSRPMAGPEAGSQRDLVRAFAEAGYGRDT